MQKVTGEGELRGGVGAGLVDADWIKNDSFGFLELSEEDSRILGPMRRVTLAIRACRIYWRSEKCMKFICSVPFENGLMLG